MKIENKCSRDSEKEVKNGKQEKLVKCLRFVFVHGWWPRNRAERL